MSFKGQQMVHDVKFYSAGSGHCWELKTDIEIIFRHVKLDEMMILNFRHMRLGIADMQQQQLTINPIMNH